MSGFESPCTRLSPTVLNISTSRASADMHACARARARVSIFGELALRLVDRLLPISPGRELLDDSIYASVSPGRYVLRNMQYGRTYG